MQKQRKTKYQIAETEQRLTKYQNNCRNWMQIPNYRNWREDEIPK
jgi:hypothetical protein